MIDRAAGQPDTGKRGNPEEQQDAIRLPRQPGRRYERHDVGVEHVVREHPGHHDTDRTPGRRASVSFVGDVMVGVIDYSYMDCSIHI